MNEFYLHYLWKNKRIPLEAFKTTDNKNVSIIYSGDYNENESGPDFFNASIKIDGLLWVGNIEIHVNSSDWYLHKHQNDKAYENVILHVVYHHNQDVFINGEIVPTIELSKFIDEKHYSNFSTLYKVSNQLLCKNGIQEIDSIYIQSMMDKSIINRLNRKVSEYKNCQDEIEVLYHLLGEAFGMKANKMAFKELTTRLPYRLIAKCNPKEKQSFVQLTSGLSLPDPLKLEHRNWMKLHRSEEVSVMNQVSWKKSGFRYPSSPEKRVEEFARLIAYFDFNQCLEILKPDKVIHQFKSFVKQQIGGSDFLVSSILVNAIVPFLYWKSNNTNDPILLDKCINILENVPPENNKIIKIWQASKIQAKNSYESQALIELYNEFCRYKKCLSCDVGNKLLNR